MKNTEKYTNFTDVKILDSSLPTLDDKLEAALVAYANDVITKSKAARENCNGYNLIKKMELVEKADRLDHHESIKKKPAYRSKIYLGWIKQAHISTVAFLISMMLSGEWFAIMGQTPEDRKNAEYMSKVVRYLFETNYNFRKVLIQALYQCVKRGMTCIKGFWQIIHSYVHEYEEVFEDVLNPITNEMQKVSKGFKQVKKRVTEYNDVEIEYVDINDFHFWPVTGNFKRSTKIQTSQVKFSDLERQKNRYENLDKLEETLTADKNNLQEADIELRECWIKSAHINGQEVNNVIATIAAGKHVIELKAMPYDYGFDSFMYTVFEPIEGSLLGKGLCFDATDLQDAANLFINMIADSCKIGTYPQTIFPKEEDPSNFVSRPGGLIPWPKEMFEKGIFPRAMELNLQGIPLTFETVSKLKQEFEAATVSELLKGIRPEKDETATRDMLVQNGSENKLTISAENFNEEVLKQLVQMILALYRQRSVLERQIMQSKPEEKPETLLKIARISLDHTKEVKMPVVDPETKLPKQMPVSDPQTGLAVIDPQTQLPRMETVMETKEINKTDEELLEELGDLVPLERIDISISGYKTNSKKAKKLQNMNFAMEGLSKFADDNTKKRIRQDNFAKDLFMCLDMDADTMFFTEDESLKDQQKKIDDVIFLEAYKAMEIAKHPELTPQQPQPGGAK